MKCNITYIPNLASADKDPSRQWMQSTPLSQIFPSAGTGMVLPTTSVLAHPISRRGVPPVFQPRRPVPPVVVDDQSQAAQGSNDETQAKKITVPLAHVPIAILRSNPHPSARFPNPILASDHETLEFPVVSSHHRIHMFTSNYFNSRNCLRVTSVWAVLRTRMKRLSVHIRARTSLVVSASRARASSVRSCRPHPRWRRTSRARLLPFLPWTLTVSDSS